MTELTSIISGILDHPPATPAEKQALIEKIYKKFESWFMRAEGQEAPNRFEKSILKTFIAWQIDEILGKN